MERAPSRREFLARTGVLAAIGAGWPGAFRIPRMRELAEERPFLDAALRAWRWIDESRITTPNGITWPADPLETTSVGTTLYSHSVGVVPFLLELFGAAGREEHLAAALAATDQVVADIDMLEDAGLYTGLAGIAYVCTAAFVASGKDGYRERALQCVERLAQLGDRHDEGVAWPVRTRENSALECNDIVSGTAGTALTLLHIGRGLGDDRSLELAIDAGRRLLRRALPNEAGRHWEMWSGYPREMPNFSHGTAGVAFALAELYKATAEADFLVAALEGARYVRSLATVTDDGYLVFHNRPDGEDLYYLGWCHGPVGTNRLFLTLAEVTGDSDWMQWVHRGARGIMNTGAPESRSPGFWENVSQCCGTAGMGEHFLSLHRLTGESAYRRFVDRLTDDIFRRATEDHNGLKWTQAEHRTRPDLLVAQTGFMQGAAGVGKFFLSLDSMTTGDGAPRYVLPDEPA